MYSSFQLAKKYLQYWWQASNGKGHGMHSPFAFDFILHVLNNGKGYPPPPGIEDLRRQLRQDHERLAVTDLGAGSRRSGATERTVASLARHALKPPKYAQLLYRLARHYQPATILELGTSLGITTAYLSAACPAATLHTIEGSGAVAGVAARNFSRLGLTNVRLHQGNFDDVLSPLLNTLPRVDLAYIDGNHREEPTLRYFEQLLPKTHEHAVLVFDDIHWSPGMEKAWEQIRQHPSVRYSIDIFFLGFVFFRHDFRVKQHFTIRF